MIGERIESILGVFGDAVYARCSKGYLYATALSAIPQPDLLPDKEADELEVDRPAQADSCVAAACDADLDSPKRLFSGQSSPSSSRSAGSQ
jgi:hypothetical protein